MNQATNKADWEKNVLNSPDRNFLQSWNWGETHGLLGKKIFRFKLKEGVAQFIKEEAKRGTYLICPGGPLIPWHEENVEQFTDLCRDLSEKEKATFIRIRPNIIDMPENRDLARKYGFISAPSHMNAEVTWQLDLSPSEDELLKNMRKTTRYLIRKAENMGVKIEHSKNENDVDVLFRLELETARRHQFVPFPLNFLKSHFQSFVNDNEIIMLKGIWKGKIVSVAMIIFYGTEAVYHYSGSSSEYPDVPVNYLLQWEAIKEAKKREMRLYNFWGIAPTDNPKHRFAGVTVFKKGFGGFRKDYLHASDLPTSFRYWPTMIFEFLRNKHRHL